MDNNNQNSNNSSSFGQQTNPNLDPNTQSQPTSPIPTWPLPNPPDQGNLNPNPSPIPGVNLSFQNQAPVNPEPTSQQTLGSFDPYSSASTPVDTSAQSNNSNSLPTFLNPTPPPAQTPNSEPSSPNLAATQPFADPNQQLSQAFAPQPTLGSFPQQVDNTPSMSTPSQSQGSLATPPNLWPSSAPNNGPANPQPTESIPTDLSQLLASNNNPSISNNVYVPPVTSSNNFVMPQGELDSSYKFPTKLVAGGVLGLVLVTAASVYFFFFITGKSSILPGSLPAEKAQQLPLTNPPKAPIRPENQPDAVAATESATPSGSPTSNTPALEAIKNRQNSQ